ncbi:MAG: molybdate ABC transporter substrate-binding protein [Pseudomonadota bacterium]|nr:molybdate ABC transporter substrate-binding protein [Pseudomonadota bacterium]
MKRLFGALVLSLLLITPAGAREKLHAAVAANFISPFKELALMFKERTGLEVEATYSSTGQIYAQIIHGAPYDLFLAADQEHPQLLYKEGRAEMPFVYATGQVVFWTKQRELCGIRGWREVMAAPGLEKVSVANPKTAPYGAAAMAALKQAGLGDAIAAKTVYAQNIAQAFQYAATGSVNGGFCALSHALTTEGGKGCHFPIPEAPPIVQSACLLKRTAKRPAAEEFIRFLASPEAAAVKKKYGYK